MQQLLDELRTFHEVALRRSFSDAGRALALTQPGVSGRIRRLERALGASLFVVRHRRVLLTPEGESLFGYTQRIFQLVDEAEQSVVEVSALQRGRLYLGASATIGVYVLPPVLGAFAQRYPGVRVSLDIGTSDEIADRVRAGELPLGLVEATVDERGLFCRRFLRDRLVLIVSPGHPWASAGRVPLRALGDAALIQREPTSGTRRMVERALAERGVTARVVMELGSTEAVKRAVVAGLGAAFVSQYSLGGELARGELHVVDVEDLTLVREYLLLMPADEYRPRAVQAFLPLLEHIPGYVPAPR